MKSECKGGGGRKRSANGSLVHSIPKFSQVRPSEKLAEVQRVLQNRIIMKQKKMKLQEDDDVEITPVKEQSADQSAVEKSRRRKPAKEEICRRPAWETIPNKEDAKVSTASSSSANSSFPSSIPNLSEVTITPVPKEAARKVKMQELDKALELDTKPQVEKVKGKKVKNPLVLSTRDFNKLGCPSGYVYCPVPGVFVHPSALGNQKPNAQQEVKPSPSSEKDSRNEVSICKFKFTGGAKPLLEQRKMMSVDSSGQFKFNSSSSSSQRVPTSSSMGAIDVFPVKGSGEKKGEEEEFSGRKTFSTDEGFLHQKPKQNM